MENDKHFSFGKNWKSYNKKNTEILKTKAEEDLNWKAKRTMAEALRDAWQWQQKLD